MNYVRYPFREELSIAGIYTFHYIELASDFHSREHRHDFWKFAYVDQGVMEIETLRNHYVLTQGDIVFYQPQLRHRVQAGQGTAPKQFIISFECAAPCLKELENTVLRLNEPERALLAEIVREGRSFFQGARPLYEEGLHDGKGELPFACQQIFKNYLEIFLLQLIRSVRRDVPRHVAKPSTLTGQKSRHYRVQQVIEYMELHLAEKLTPLQISRHFSLSLTMLKTAFRQETGCSLIQYMNQLRLEKAKTLIRENHYNFTQISEMTGYASSHYFSKHFKQKTGMTPTEYARSIMARTQNHRQA